MEDRHGAWIEVVTSGDVDAYADLVTEDVVWMPPHGPAVVGRAAFRSWLRPFFEEYAYEFSLEGVRSRASERWIAETGTFRSRMTPGGGGAAAEHGGRYLALWRRDAGAWRIERYIDLGDLVGP